MCRLIFIFEEFVRSVQNSIVKNILLMSMFSLSIVMMVLMTSYYFQLDQKYELVSCDIDDTEWYNITIDEEDDMEFNEVLKTVSGCKRVMNYYDDIVSQNTNLISLNTYQEVYIKKSDLTNWFGDKQFIDYLIEYNSEAIKIYWDEDTMDVQDVYAMKSIQIDIRAFDKMGLLVYEGEKFSEGNIKLQKSTDYIPVILGSDYRDIISIGQIMEIKHLSYNYKCKVIGYLEEGVTIPRNGDRYDSNIRLDNYIVMPYGVTVNEIPDNDKEIEKFACFNYNALYNSNINILKNNGMKEQIDKFRVIANKYSLPSLRILGAAVGLDLFRKESAENVNIMFTFSLVLLFFTLYSFFVSFYDKIKSNCRVYGIYLVNGCSLSLIVVSFMIELLFLFLPPVFICNYILSMEDVGIAVDTNSIMVATEVIGGIFYIIGVLFIVFLLKGTDTEQLIRCKE